MNIVPRSFPGPGHLSNKGAIDCCKCGLLAYGSNQIVVVVDTRSCNQVQTLHRHSSYVNQVKWTTSCTNDKEILLASADLSGLIIIWNVAQSAPIHQFKDGLRSVFGLYWIPDYSAESYCLLVMQQPSAFTMLDIDSGKQLWKKAFQMETITGGDLDPYDCGRAAVLCQGGVLLVEDIAISKPPSTCRRFHVSVPKTHNSPSNEGLRTRERLRKLVKEFVAGEVSPNRTDESVECLQVCFHRAVRDMLLLLYPKECLLMDLVLGQTVGVISSERSISPFSMVVPVRQRDAFFFFHESGSVSGRFLRSQDLSASVSEHYSSIDSNWSSQPSLSDFSHDLVYDQKCHTDLVRATASNKFLGGVLNPLTERHIYVYTMDGRIYQLEFRRSGEKTSDNEILSDLLPPLRSLKGGKLKFQHRLLITGIISGMNSPCQVIKPCPLLLSKGSDRQHYLATGNKNGSLYLVNLSSGILEKEISVHTNAVKGIEWTSSDSVLSFSTSEPSGISGRVKNEIFHTNFTTGEMIHVKREVESESPVIMIRVSPLRQVFIVVLKDCPIELWDVTTLTLLRVMPKKFPPVVALEWHRNTKLTRQHSIDESDSSEPSISAPPVRVSVKERIIFADGETSKLYVMSIEGSVLSEGKTIPSKGIVGKISCICWKNDIFTVGDTEGNLIIWDTKNNIYKRLDVQKSSLKKISFGSGKSASKLLVLSTEGMEIWDLKDDCLTAQLRWPVKDSVRILDADWLSPSTVAMACSDGMLRVMDSTLKHSSSPLADYKMFSNIQSFGALPQLLRDFFKRYLIFKADLSGDLREISSLDDEQISILENCWNQLNPMLRQELSTKSTPLAIRACEVSKLFGSSDEVDLWMLALRYNKGGPELDIYFDYLADQNVCRRYSLEKASIYDGKRTTYEQTRRIARDLLMLGERNQAVTLLLDVSPAEKSFYQDHLLACLISAADEPSSEKFSSTIKLVATSLMTAGRLWEGIELLALASRNADACKYLQSYGKWEEAARIARCSLDELNLSDIVRKCAEHLLQHREKIKSVQLLTSIRDWIRAVEYALMSQDPFLAACLASLCEDFPENLRNSLMHSLKNDLLKVGFKLPSDFSFSILQ